MKVVIGLGNPGKKYENTRHNVGFIYLDKLAQKYQIDFKEKFNALIGETIIADEKVIFVKPQTFMNLSGTAVKKVLDFYKLLPNDILLIYDDLAMDFGKIKLKINSSAGGHNGVKDIINQLHTQKLLRIKFGILNENKKDTKDFVLAKFSKVELVIINEKYSVIEDIINDFITLNVENYDKLLNKYN